MRDPDEEDEVVGEPDDPDLWADEAEYKAAHERSEEQTDNERDDHENVPAVDGTPDDGDGDACCGPRP
jgi:hypothetical protein